MIRKILFFFLLSLSFTRFYSQKDLSISLQGKVHNKDNMENIFGATLYLMDKDVFISKSVSLSNGTFLLTAEIPRSDTYDLIVSKNGFILKKILIDLSSLDFEREYQNNIPLKKDMNINLYSQSLYPNINNSDSFYSEKYKWNLEERQLISDENYLIQAEGKLKLSNTPIAKVIIDSAAIKTQDETIISNLTDILKQAKSYSKEKNLKLSIEKYNEAELLSSKLSNSNSNQLYISSLKAEKTKLLEVKNSEDLVFNSQLIKANEYFAQGQNGYAKAKLILRTDPMRGRVNDPKVIDLTDKINQMESYFSMKKTAYLLVKSKKKNQESITSLKITQEKAILNQKIIPQNELAQLKKSIDSLENIINPMSALIPKKVIPASTQDQGTILLAPGEIHTGKNSDAYKDIFIDKDKKENAATYKMEIIKNDLEYTTNFKSSINASQSQDAQVQINEIKNVIDSILSDEQKNSEQRQYQMQEQIATLNQDINERNLSVIAQNELIITEISENKNQLDIIQKKQNDENSERLEKQMDAVQISKDRILIIEQERHESEEDRYTEQQQIINNLDYSRYQKDSISKANIELGLSKIQKMKDYQKYYETTPNYLKNEDGVLYEKNKMTEVIYKIKNLQGYVSSVIIRRIVVDINGYGVVYEQTTNESGKNSFTRNGLLITETIWFNESTGDNVIKK
ncbi:MAG: hypothetical protein EBR35_02095 [Flavobacteriales bacterium]|nr:hypothetical protein [Flavobacteriales bacterium]